MPPLAGHLFDDSVLRGASFGTTQKYAHQGADVLQSWGLAEKPPWQGPRSSRNPEQASNEGGLSPYVPPANVPNLPLSDHRHPLVASQRSSRGWQAAKAQPRPD